MSLFISKLRRPFFFQAKNDWFLLDQLVLKLNANHFLLLQVRLNKI